MNGGTLNGDSVGYVFYVSIHVSSSELPAMCIMYLPTLRNVRIISRKFLLCTCDLALCYNHFRDLWDS